MICRKDERVLGDLTAYERVFQVQHKKMTADQASRSVQREHREWKYKKMSEVGGLTYRFSGVHSSSQEQ